MNPYRIMPVNRYTDCVYTCRIDLSRQIDFFLPERFGPTALILGGLVVRTLSDGEVSAQGLWYSPRSSDAICASL